jgi:hypothetical protein
MTWNETTYLIHHLLAQRNAPSSTNDFLKIAIRNRMKSTKNGPFFQLKDLRSATYFPLLTAMLNFYHVLCFFIPICRLLQSDQNSPLQITNWDDFPWCFHVIFDDCYWFSSHMKLQCNWPGSSSPKHCGLFGIHKFLLFGRANQLAIVLQPRCRDLLGLGEPPFSHGNRYGFSMV